MIPKETPLSTQSAVRPSDAREPSEVAQQPTGETQRFAATQTRNSVILGLRYGLGIVVGCANMLVLTWWIGPHDYGVFVTAIGLASFLSSLSRMGADTYLVRSCAEPDARDYEVATALIALSSLLLLLLGAGAVPLLVRWYGSREFMWPYLATLTTIPLAGMAGPAIAKLERALNFRSAAGIELGGQVVGLMVSMALAWRHAGVWAPVAGAIAWQTWVVVAAYASAGIRLRLQWDWRRVTTMLSFGAGYTLSQRIWQMRFLVNPLLVGKLAGAEAVAFVALAVRIGESLGFIRAAAGRLAIAGLARMQGESERLRQAAQRAVELQVLALGPLLCLFAVAGPVLIHRFFGARWLPTLAVYPWVAAGVLINSVFNLQASTLFVLGEQWAVLRAYSVHVILLGMGTFLLVPQFGISAYGWAELLACIAYVWIHRSLTRSIALSYRRISRWCAGFIAALWATTTNRGSMWGILAAAACAFIPDLLHVWRTASARFSKPTAVQPGLSPSVYGARTQEMERSLI